MVIAPQNEIVLLNLPLEIDNKNQLTFSDANAQFQYFRFQTEQKQYDNCTYIRKDGYVVINDNFDNLLKYNYCMYQNENFTTKWFYAFIVKMEWLSPNSTKVYIKTDVFQTYQFDVTYLASWVEREMVNVADDNIGSNLLNEGLELGEYVENVQVTLSGFNHVYVIAYARNPSDDGLDAGTFPYQGCFVNNIASGLFYCVCSGSRVLGILKQINVDGHGNDVKAVFTVPSCAVNGLNSLPLSTLDNINSDFEYWIPSVFTGTPLDIDLLVAPQALNGYSPRNKKLRNYPFQYLGFTPTNGESKVFRYEDFASAHPKFKVICEVNPNPSPTFIPVDFKGVSGVNVSECAKITGYPNIAWTTDYFSNWIAQNSNLVDLNISRLENEAQWAQNNAMLSALGSFGEIMKGALGGGYGSGLLGLATIPFQQMQTKDQYDFAIQNVMLEKEKQQMLPNSATMGTNAGLLGFGYMNSDMFTRYSIKYEYAERIDMYFDMFGYQTNKLKVPNISNRPKWNYIKTLGVNIIPASGKSVPQEDLQEFKALFNDGVTLWHDSSHFLDYSQNNRT